MIYEIKVPNENINRLFSGWEETLIYSCLQGVMGKIYATDKVNPMSACAYVGCFAFFAGISDRELIMNIPNGFSILTPQSKDWENLIEECFPNAKKTVRYAINKDTKFDKEYLESLKGMLPVGYDICRIDSELYDECLKNQATYDFVSVFETKERYLSLGRGYVILKDGKIVAGASSYTRYNEGIEIAVDTLPEERRKHLATIVCATLILDCLDNGLYPSWDAQNMNSVKLSEKLGYTFSHEYTVYEAIKE